MDVYINSANFSTATAVFEDESLTVKSPDGFYSDNTYYRRQQDGVLQDVVLCSSTTPGTPTPTVSTAAITNNTTGTSATSGGTVIDNGATISMKGVCWGISSNPTIANTKTENGAGGGTFTSSITGLSAGQVYNVRAYATTSTGQTVYGSNVTFTATAGAAAQTVTTAGITNNTTGTSATSGGNVTANGATISMKGVCWSTSANPTIANTKTEDGAGGGIFTSSITGLTNGQSYNVRAYATNSLGQTAYGSNVTFTATAGAAAQTVTTAGATAVTSTTATSGGTVTANGATITQKGVCWGLNANPTISDPSTNNGAGEGTFTSSITGLSASTGYNIRAYATNSLGQTVYGSNVTFTTTAGVSVPTVLTVAITDLTNTSARSGGDITNTGGATITQKGVCWSEFTAQPTIADTITTEGGGSGDYMSFITLLEPGITYNIRAYATNSAGTGYATNTLQFTTTNIPYTLGQQVEGGTIVYFLTSSDVGYDANRQHGLVAALSDNISAPLYPGVLPYDPPTSEGIGSGLANTNAIVQNYSTSEYANNSYSPKTCYNLQDGGYTDWYLPSILELKEVWNSRTYLPNPLVSAPSTTTYASSSRYPSSSSAQTMYGDTGVFTTDTPYDPNISRAVRSF